MKLIQRWKTGSPQHRVAIAASAAAAVVWIAVAVVPEPARPTVSEPVASPPQRAASRQRAPEPSAPTSVVAESEPSGRAPRSAARPALAPAQATPAADALRAGLAADNSGTRIEALRAAGALDKTQAPSVLPLLLAQDLARDPEVAPTLIQVTARLAQRSAVGERERAVAQLSRWLRAELARQGVDARANVSVLVEALGTIPSPEVAPALIEVVDDEALPLHLQTLAVEGLARAATPAAHGVLERFRARLGASQREGFELELQREAEQAADRALRSVVNNRSVAARPP